jgi:transcriptional regulator with XRE-family HTH domain
MVNKRGNSMKAKYSLKNRIAELLAIKARDEGRSSIPQQEIEKETGITQHSISRHIRNQVTRYDEKTIILWCQYLDITPSEFFAWMPIKEDDEGADEPKEESALLPLSA